MEKSLIEKLRDAKRDHEVSFVNFFNNGTVNTDERYYAKNASDIKAYKTDLTLDVLEQATSSYARHYDFDTISMEMIMGLVYDKNDVDENNDIRKNAQPLYNVARFYTGRVNSYLDGNQTNVANFYDYAPGRQGYVYYNDFVKYVKKMGLTFDGPESFEEFKKLILSGELFDINVVANLLEEKENKKLVKKL